MSYFGEKRLQFIREHQDAFDVEPIFPMALFEEFVVKTDECDFIQASCKIETDQLIASRFSLGSYSEQFQPWPSQLNNSLNFLRKVESRVGVQINYDLFRKFFTRDFDFSKLKGLTTGIDLRETLEGSSLKQHIIVDSAIDQEKLEMALELGEIASESMRTFFLKTAFLIGFDYFLDGHSEIELYCKIEPQLFIHPDIQGFLRQNFSTSTLKLAQALGGFGIGYSKGNLSPVLYFHILDRRSLQSYFKLNDLACQANNFYQNKETKLGVGIGIAEQEFYENRINNIRLYYKRFFSNLRNHGDF
jgi:LynF/TruF/PatF family peptide O-prenyltransferase